MKTKSLFAGIAFFTFIGQSGLHAQATWNGGGSSITPQLEHLWQLVRHRAGERYGHRRSSSFNSACEQLLDQRTDQFDRRLHHRLG